MKNFPKNVKKIFFTISLLINLPLSSFTLPSVCESDWILAASSVLAVGGGAIAGYAAGHNENIRRRRRILEIFTFPTSQEERTLEWIVPLNDAIDGPLISVQIFAPDQTLYFSTSLGRGLLPPNPPNLGGVGQNSLVGQYRVVFTVIEPGAGPSHFGGINFNGIEILTPENTNDLISSPLQEIIVIDYPSGPFA